MSEAAGVTVVVPVKDGARYLEEVLAAVAGQRIDAPVETLVIDSGSRDGSPAIAHSLGARVLVIEPGEFGHGRTRNLAMEQARGDVVAFLTQDATPAGELWLKRLTTALDADGRVGLAFGPHLPRPGTSPAIARELEEFFGSFAPNGEVRIDGSEVRSDPATGFFSNVNSCVTRACWEDVRFREVAYAEDQAFARDAMAKGWKKAYVPEAGVLHAHDYGFVEFMRRYFDEYRGLRETLGHVEPAAPGRALRTIAAQVRRDVEYTRRQGHGRGGQLTKALGSARHHAGRAAFAALGSRAKRLPDSLAERLSLEGRGGGSARWAGIQAALRARHVPASSHRFEYVRSYFRSEPAALAKPSPSDTDDHPLHLAWVIPPFRRGSGGHMTIFNIVAELEARGHSCSIWVHDPAGHMGGRAALIHRELSENFADLRAGVFLGFDDWHGADVALATGWQTAYPLASLPGCRLKTYLVQDLEPEFYPASSEWLWADYTYRMGYPCVTASPWLTERLQTRFGATADHFELGVDHGTYRALGAAREQDTVVFYARPVTPRRGTELGILALAEVAERRPGTRFVLFGDTEPPTAGFDFEFAGVVDERALSTLYNSATVGLVLSLTNYSRIPKEMMACGLPVVDVRHPSVESVFGRDERLISLADPQPISIAERVIDLLDAPDRRERLAAQAREFVAPMTWQSAAVQVEGILRKFLRERWERDEKETAVGGLSGL